MCAVFSVGATQPNIVLIFSDDVGFGGHESCDGERAGESALGVFGFEDLEACGVTRRRRDAEHRLLTKRILQLGPHDPDVEVAPARPQPQLLPQRITR